MIRERKKLDPEKCQKEVWQKNGGWTQPYKQCSRKGVVEEGGKLWCRQHAPSAEVQRKVVLEEAYQERRREEDRRKDHAVWERVLRMIEGVDPAQAIQLRQFARKHDFLD